ncbi:MAG: ribonuclease 3, partial [Clostridia bacterium]|nr:ribonuclease 3 [Clostridia bacterium]
MNDALVETIINYTFKNKELLRRALTHPSFFNQTQQNYQKLEYLGDSILDFVVA